jgi:uncharacterized membrane protein
MGPHWERRGEAPDAPQSVMDTVLRPHRSLSPAGFKTMFSILVALNIAAAMYAWALHALLVLPFLGLDLLAVWIAFRVSYRDGLVEERVRVSPDHVLVEQQDGRGGRTHWVTSALWARPSLEEKWIAIRAGGKEVRIGAFLSRPEREDFARALSDALWRAKRTLPYPSA